MAAQSMRTGKLEATTWMHGYILTIYCLLPPAAVNEGRWKIAPDDPAAFHFGKILRQQRRKAPARRQHQALQIGKRGELTAGPEHACGGIQVFPLRICGQRSPRQTGHDAVRLRNFMPIANRSNFADTA